MVLRLVLYDRIGLQVKSAFLGLVGKRLGDVWVCLGCLGVVLGRARFRRGLGTASAERVGAEAAVPRVAPGVLDAEIRVHLTHAADLDTRVRLSVIMPGFPRK